LIHFTLLQHGFGQLMGALVRYNFDAMGAIAFMSNVHLLSDSKFHVDDAAAIGSP
jgi:hypothetical protein